MGDGRINVGLFIGNPENSFDNAVCEGVMRAAKEADVNLVIFPGRYLKGQYYERARTRCEYQNNTLFSYVNDQNIDLLVVLMGTIGTVLTDAEKKIFLDMYPNIPIYLIADEMEGYGNILFDNRSGLKEGIVDFIVNKKRKRIGMFSGPQTNEDAVVRLNVYKETLQEYGLPVEEDLVAYGDFSEFCEDKVKEFIQKNPAMDAIVFANDQMAIGGYRAMKELGIKIGDDIAVMGFDDAPIASKLEPNLTSVKADAVELGRQGLLEAIKFYHTKEIRTTYVKTGLVKRQSGGSSENIYLAELEKKKFGAVFESNKEEAAEILVKTVFGEAGEDQQQVAFLKQLSQCVCLFFDEIEQEETQNNASKIQRGMTELRRTRASNLVVMQNVYVLFDTLRLIIKNYVKDTEIQERVSDLLYQHLLFWDIIDLRFRRKMEDDLNEIMFMSNSLTRDMLIHGEENDMSYHSVTEKLEQLGFQSAYLYTFGNPYLNDDPTIWHDWKIPANAMLKSYFSEKGRIETVPKKNQKIKTLCIFHNEFMPSQRRHTLFLNPIFINNEQYGMLLCELEFYQLAYLPPILAQLSSAFKIIHMLKMQAGIQKQLEVSLKKIQVSNQILETISKSDELTGIYNRRGFFEQAIEKIRDGKNEGKTAILLFVDLDNLKIINDRLGHEEGDFALRSVADILKDSMRASDVVARIGGDEFVALAVIEKQATGESIKSRIKNLTVHFNEECKKPYYIGVSVGFAEFLCGKDVEIEPYLELADEKLYLDKQKKRTDIMK